MSHWIKMDDVRVDLTKIKSYDAGTYNDGSSIITLYISAHLYHQIRFGENENQEYQKLVKTLDDYFGIKGEGKI